MSHIGLKHQLDQIRFNGCFVQCLSCVQVTLMWFLLSLGFSPFCEERVGASANQYLTRPFGVHYALADTAVSENEQACFRFSNDVSETRTKQWRYLLHINWSWTDILFQSIYTYVTFVSLNLLSKSIKCVHSKVKYHCLYRNRWIRESF